MVFLSRAQLFFKIVLQTTLVEKYGVNDRPKCHGFAREDIQDTDEKMIFREILQGIL
jgi:hypothetical protein